LLAPDAAAQALPAGWFTGRHDGATGLRVHRNTVLGAFSEALRQSYPAIDKLVGEAYFDRMAVEFARAQPPGEPQLASWGAGFAQFAGAFPGTAGLPFLTELARFEWLLDELGRSLPGQFDAAQALPLGEGLTLQLNDSLRLLPTRFPVASLHEALLAEDAPRVAQLAAQVGECGHALWRDADGVHARLLRPEAARCLAALQGGAALDVALEAGRGAQGEAEFMSIVTAELLQAGFTHISGATR
jgi:hypothetical protein